MKEKIIRLSKSQYVKGRQCIKKVWLYNHKRELADKPTDFQSLIFKQGYDVGSLAQEYFLEGEKIIERYDEVEDALEQSKLAISNGKTILYEAAFIHDDILVRVDIIKKNKNNTWDLIEVKSSSSWKKSHCLDLAVQKYVVEGAGLKVNSVSIMHLNKDYVQGNELNLKGLFHIEPLDQEILPELDLVPDYLENIKAHLKIDEEPSADIGSVCKSPYPCEFKSYCWQDIPEKSIHKLTRINDKKRFDLIEQGCYEIIDIPDDYKLSDSQRIQVECEKSGDAHIEACKTQEYLKTLEYPYYFLDFETLPLAIPQFKGFSPYQHFTFQYSLHVKESEKAELKHYEYLHDGTDNPVVLLEDLFKYLGSSGSIVVYNKTFEKGRLEEFRKLAPEYEEIILGFVNRLWDLMKPFQKKWIYYPEMNGSYSIKYVLSALDPSLNYKSLNIQKGDEAITAFLKYVDSKNQKIKEELFKYCKLDTYARYDLLNNSNLLIKGVPSAGKCVTHLHHSPM